MSAAKSKLWRRVRLRDGRAVLRSPDGREWLGTAAEIRAAALTPWRRSMLADGLRVQWLTTKPRTAVRRELVRNRRFDALSNHETDMRFHATCPAYLPPTVAVLARAAARLFGVGVDEWVASAAEAGILAAARESGGCLPLTRHERVALARLEGARDE